MGRVDIGSTHSGVFVREVGKRHRKRMTWAGSEVVEYIVDRLPLAKRPPELGIDEQTEKGAQKQTPNPKP